MKALILNSGTGSRLGNLTENTPKCLVELNRNDTILSRQVSMLIELGVDSFIITTGPFGSAIQNYLGKKFPGTAFTFIKNEKYSETNYIYSMYLADATIRDNLLLLHGDIVTEESVLKELIESNYKDAVIIDSTVPLPEKDFKGRIENNTVQEIGVNIEAADNTIFLLPVYKLSKSFMNSWMDEISSFVTSNNTGVYAENAFNTISHRLKLHALDIKGNFCMEVDTLDDLEKAKAKTV